jgi:hypothetical protein
LTQTTSAAPVRRDAAQYRESHSELLRQISTTPGRDAAHLDAVVVPTNRGLAELPGLRLAAQVAKDRGSELIVVCSGKAQAAGVSRQLTRGLDGMVTVVDLDAVSAGAFPYLASSAHPVSWKWRVNDVGVKRNLGLMLGVMAGWRHVLFLDDDVSLHADGRTLDSGGLTAAMAEFAEDPHLRAVGWSLHGFDDNSVAGHARRSVGLAQDVFIGGAALAVRCDVTVPFFPSVYNEDWLFLIALAARSARWRGSLAEAGWLHQLPYHPYQRARAKSEEVGDILAEGLINLLEDDGPGLWSASSEAFWANVRSQRFAMLQRIVGRLCPGSDARDALQAALDVHGDVHADDLAGYVSAWQDDLTTWADHLTHLKKLTEERPSREKRTVADLLAPLLGERAAVSTVDGVTVIQYAAAA